jgi:glycerophosphoryl diester phosphodiesterase
MLCRRQWIASLTAFALPASSQTKVDVIAHRGEHIECPENTMPAIEKAIALGVDWVELDVRTTKDGHFVLMHNSSVDATTDGKGEVADLTLAEIRALDAGAHKPQFKGTKVPTLDQALSALRGKAGLYLDAKRISAEAIVASLKKHDMIEHCVVYGGFNLLKALTALGYAQLAMPEAVSVEVSQRILKELNVRVIAYDRRDFTPEILAIAKEAKKGIFVDRLGEQDTPAHWNEAVSWGATGIQTDHPEQLIAMLRANRA